MSKTTIRALSATLLLATTCASWGCVADRPARNGVFNENQYLQKSFIIRPGDGTAPDTGWMLKATVVQVSTPNPLGSSVFGIYSGTESGGQLVRFAVTSDHLQMLNLRDLQNDPVTENATTPEVLNSWPATNVDLKYQVNLDGEKTNFYSENQELDWQVRQWVKLQWDKNDMSDLAALGSGTYQLLALCTDAANYSTTLVPNSFLVDEPNDYIEWTTSITMPILMTSQACATAFNTGALNEYSGLVGRQSVTLNMKYSLVRANPSPTYQPLVVSEKDPIRHKYAGFDWIAANIDSKSGQLAALQMEQRFDPTKPITWYLDPGIPADYLTFFTCNGTLPGSNPPVSMQSVCEGKNVSESDTIEGQTNAIMTAAKAKSMVTFLMYNDETAFGDGAGPTRSYGDVRYNWYRWVSDETMQDGFAGVTQFVPDPRTGEILSASITLNDFAIKDLYVQRVDAYLESIGASLNVDSTGEWAPPSTGKCTAGATVPIVAATLAANHNGTDSLYTKIQTYLGKPSASYGNLGPADFIVPPDQDFLNAYYAIIPYEIFADPDMNPFVIREGGAGVTGPASIWQDLQNEAAFQAQSAIMNNGQSPYDGAGDGPQGLQNMMAFQNQMRDLTQAHKKAMYHLQMRNVNGQDDRRTLMDPPESFSFETVIAKDARHCIQNVAPYTGVNAPQGGTHWETKEEWVADLITTYWSQVAWHEFGHSLGLAHNFMGSIDARHFPTYTDAAGTHIGLYSNSVMEYNAAPDRIFWHAGWAPYDQGAIGWLYANAQTPTDLGSGLNGSYGPYGNPNTVGLTGQTTLATSPWRDPYGFQSDGKTENQYLLCSDVRGDMAYTPFCRQGDMGATPSAIMANAIDANEWQYSWRNFRAYRKYWDSSAYASQAVGFPSDMRRFLSQWIYDWQSTDLVNHFRELGINPPGGSNATAAEYYAQLTNKFNADISMSNQLVAAWSKAIINEASGERPFATIYDAYYGDVTQQGIILDKFYAMQSWTGLWPTDNYDQDQAGSYVSSYGIAAGLDASYQAIAEDAILSMIGGQYDVYPYFVPFAVGLFAQDTHNPAFVTGTARPEIAEWTGGWVFGSDEAGVVPTEQFLAYFRQIAVNDGVCTDVPSCTFDPRSISDTHNQFLGPDGRIYIWALIPDRNQIVVCQKETNLATYVIVRNYTDDVINNQDDGAFPGGAWQDELPMKYFLDSFTAYN